MFFSRPLPLLALLIGLTLATYWTGLQGPFLFDDAPNFHIVKAWSAGQVPLRQVMFGNDSWLSHRSLAMGSFALNTALFGYQPYGFKLINLGMHIACGIVAFAFLSALLHRDPVLAQRGRLVAALIVGVWLLHPLNVSTVLYAVQRMTQLAALCCLLGLWLYVSVRGRQEQGDCRFGWPLLFIGIPLLTLLGIQGKQNAVILPLLCLVLELAYFRAPRAWPRPLTVFYGLLLLLPAVFALVTLIARPELLLNGYDEYPFTPMQRLMSEARVICEYIRMLLAPITPGMGVYTDDYVASTGLLSPPTTLLAISALLALTIGAWRVCKRWPSIFAGWCFFLAAHAVEGSILPIELYYEHRNYLPAIGLFLACAGLVAAAGKQLSKQGIRGGRIGIVVVAALVTTLGLLTHGRARIWSDPLLLSESALRNHPDSSRAVVSYAGMSATYGDYPRARNALDGAIATTSNGYTRAHALLFRIWLDCHFTRRASEADLAAAVDSLPPFIDLTTLQMLRYARTPFESASCNGITLLQMADAHAAMVEKATTQSDDAWPKYFLRLKAGRLYAGIERWDLALEQARKINIHTAPVAALSFLVLALKENGQIAEATATYKGAKARVRRGNKEDLSAIRQMESLLATTPSEGGR